MSDGSASDRPSGLSNRASGFRESISGFHSRLSGALDRSRVPPGLRADFDDTGVVVFLAAVVFLGGLWRVDFLLNDSETVANLLVNVADGRLAVTDAPYSLTAGEQPGLVEVDGALYGRNYGQVYLAVPLLWLLEAVSGLLDLRLLIAAGWSLSLLGLARASARLLERPVVADAGTILALATFAGSMLVATEIWWLDGPPRPVVALGLSTLLLAAVAATVLYRLLSWAHGRRIGLVGGLGLILATPIGFWGTFPKRHVLSATALLVVCYLFAVSRTGTGRRATLARAGAYATVGFLASVHAFEAAFAFAVLLPIDLLTAPSNDRRTLAVIAVVFLLALVPMLATNAAISGDPLQSPRTLPGADGGLAIDPVEASVGGSGASGGTEGSVTPDGGAGSVSPGSEGDGDGEAIAAATGSHPARGAVRIAAAPSPLDELVERIRWIGAAMLGALFAGLAAATEPDRLYHVFVRSGWIPGVDYHVTDFETLELALLETLPLAGSLLYVTASLGGRLRTVADSPVDRLRTGPDDPVRQTDLLVGCLGVTFVLIYLPLLPIHAMITLRYVVPVMPLVLYGVCRLLSVRAVIADAPRHLGAAFLGTIFLGGIALWLTLVVLEPAQGEAVQLHGLVGLATSVLAGAVVTAWPIHRRTAVVAVGLGIAAGATTLLIVFAGLVYFADGNHALDLVGLATGALPAIG